MAKNKAIAPFLKWVGGKRQLMPAITALLPDDFDQLKYYEPFVGGGAVLFHLQPKNALINDFNKELVNVYQVIKNDPHALIEDLKSHKNEEEYFYAIRAWDRGSIYPKLSAVTKASRIIFLNKTCFNGLYRVNSSGEFNAPFGRYQNPKIVNKKTILAVSDYLNSNDIDIRNGDFEDALKDIKKDSFVYFDPPYDPVSKSANFTGYVQGGFDHLAQKRLRNVCNKLTKKGVKFLLSNSATPFIEELYKDYTITYAKAKRAINVDAKKRGHINEVLIRNYG